MPKKEQTKKEEKKQQAAALSENSLMLCYQAVGRRKVATARVKLYVVPEGQITLKETTVKKGDIIVNYRPVEQYFPGEVSKKYYLEPFRTTNTIGRFAVSALISGGGPSGQLDALIHGISRALEKVEKEKFRPILKKKGYLTRDPRAKERRKAGFAQKARARKQSPKR
jgi:small subunit ribosomal protein S9